LELWRQPIACVHGPSGNRCKPSWACLSRVYPRAHAQQPSHVPPCIHPSLPLVATDNFTCTGRLTLKHNLAGLAPGSTPGSALLTINCGGAFFLSNRGSASLLRGIEAVNNTIIGSDGNGGAICADMASSLAIYGLPSLIANNSATGFGGGIFMTGGSTLQLVHAAIDGNAAEAGGGVYLQDDAQASLTDCTASGNAAAADGGGVAARDVSHLNMTKCAVVHNTVRLPGAQSCLACSLAIAEG
jgi:predicted outer membrane repeat protein